MTRFASLHLGVAGLILALVPVAPAGAGSATSVVSASLSVSPKLYVGGQAVAFRGNLGATGVRTIWLQSHIGRQGDEWTRVQGFRSTTAQDGSFRFTYPAASMFGIRYRVVARGLATPAYTFKARSQDLVLTAVPNSSGLGQGQVLAGKDFRITVDTTPTLSHRPDLPPPPIPGRSLTLQLRDDKGQWTTQDRTTADANGNGAFTVPATNRGCLVYRVRQEEWTKGGSRIGWFPSFPTPVDVVASAGSSGSCVRPPSAPSSTTTPPKEGNAPAATTAAGTYKWGQPLWDFAWERGQSLTSRPSGGSDRQGWWWDRSTGLGRASQHNGGLLLDSQRDWSGPGDFGTTSATLRGNAARYGRWEAKMRFKRLETGARNYTARIELVPDRAKDYACGSRTITVASVPVGRSGVVIGARNGTRRWHAKRHITIGQNQAVAFAVEVARRHVTWFYNGKAIGTVRSGAAVSGVPLTMRLRLVGPQNREMNKTGYISDWQRGFDLHAGRLVTGGASLRRDRQSGGC
jgi:hypothetical protein